MTETAESRLSRLLGRLLTAAEASLAAGDIDGARATVEEVRAVDPDNEGAARMLERLAAQQRGPTGERALMTLLFADLVGSTQLSERLEPEQLRDLFSVYRAEARRAVERYGGYVMKYMGDGILAGFGYPQAHEDDARRGVLAALDVVSAVRGMEADLTGRFGVTIRVRVGIHTGRVVITDLSDQRSSDERESIVGAAPNLAARIQSAAQPDHVVISDVTQHLVDADFYLASLGEQRFKGIGRPVEVFTVQRPRHAGARFQAERYHHGILVEREAPRERMLAAWADIQRTGRSVEDSFLVVGEAGIGKTRLVAEVVDAVQAAGGRVLGAGCLPYYSNVALWPIRETAERILSTASADRPPLDVLVEHLHSLGIDPGRAVPFLAPLVGLKDFGEYPAPELDPSAVLDETLNQFVEWLAALAVDAPRLFVVEDLHWSDPSTMGLLGRLVARKAPGILVVATTRTVEEVPWRDQATVLGLGRLGDAAAGELVDALAGGREIDGDLRASIVTRAEGVPLFVEELTRSCLDVSREDPMPLRLQELFTWRLRAPAIDLRVVQAAATVGPAFDADVVAEVVGDADAVGSQMVTLSQAGIIEAEDPAAGLYRFRHALMRDAAYETQVLDARSATHARVAEVLGARGAEPALVAEHLDRAGDARGAATQYLVGAQAEQGRGAHTEAAKLLTRALDLLQTLPESEQRDLDELTDRMLRALSVSSMQGYASPDVQADHRRAEALAMRLGNRPEVLPSLIAIWAYWFTRGEHGTARGLIDRLADLVSRSAFSWFRPEVESCAGFQDLLEGHLVSAEQHLAAAMDGFASRPTEQSVSPFWPLPNDPVAVSAVALAVLSVLRGYPDSVVDSWEDRALARTGEIGFPRGPWSLAFVKTYLAWLRRVRGLTDEARALGGQVVAIGQEHGYAYWMLLGSAYTAGSGADEADLGAFEQTITMLQALGQYVFAPSHLEALADLHAARGDLDKAAGLVDQALELVARTGEELHRPELLRRRADLALARGAPEDARRDLQDALRCAKDQGAGLQALRAAVAVANLPEGTRPEDWRDTLAEIRGSLPTGTDNADTAAADALLT